MINTKMIGTICAFIGLNVWIVAIALNVSTEELNPDFKRGKGDVDKKIFKQLSYYNIEDLRPSLELQAKKLKVIRDNQMYFTAPIGKLHSNNKVIDYIAAEGTYTNTKGELNLSGAVKLDTDDSNYRADKLSYDAKKKLLVASGSVHSMILDEKTKDKLYLTSDAMRAYPDVNDIYLSGHVTGLIKRKRRYEGRLNFSSELMSFKGSESLLGLDKSVKIRRNNYDLNAGKAEIFLQNFNKKLKYYVLYDDVKLVEKIELQDGTVQKRRAFAEKLEAHQSTGKIVLTGAPKVEQGDDIIKGYQITLRENVELVEVDDSQTSFSLKKEKQ